MSSCLPVERSILSCLAASDTPSSLEIKHRIDSPLHQNAKAIPNKNLLQARKGAYKPAYKQNRKFTPNESQGLQCPIGAYKAIQLTVIDFEYF
jgi:hypothetical protein